MVGKTGEERRILGIEKVGRRTDRNLSFLYYLKPSDTPIF